LFSLTVDWMLRLAIDVAIGSLDYCV